jgi:hypothetical protein
MSGKKERMNGPQGDLWAEAKRKCRLNEETLRMAKELGLAPRSLLKNIPSPSERWKAPVHVWIREIYAKRQAKAGSGRGPAARPEGRRVPEPGAREVAPRLEASLSDDSSDGLDLINAELDADPWSDPLAEGERPWGEPGTPSAREIREQRALLEKGRRAFAIAAEHVSAALADAPEVRRIVLFGSVAAPPPDEVPRFREYRRAGVLLPHECKDVDLAVWLDDLGNLDGLRKRASRSLSRLFEEEDIGVAHHQVDVFLLEPGTNRYLGRLCHFNRCPKEKSECLVPDCGRVSFLRQIEGFSLRPDAIDMARSVLLYDRDSTRAGGGAPAEGEIPTAGTAAVPSAAKRFRRKDPF